MFKIKQSVLWCLFFLIPSAFAQNTHSWHLEPAPVTSVELQSFDPEENLLTLNFELLVGSKNVGFEFLRLGDQAFAGVLAPKLMFPSGERREYFEKIKAAYSFDVRPEIVLYVKLEFGHVSSVFKDSEIFQIGPPVLDPKTGKIKKVPVRLRKTSDIPKEHRDLLFPVYPEIPDPGRHDKEGFGKQDV